MKIAGWPLEAFGDTVKIEGLVVGDGHDRAIFILPGENSGYSGYSLDTDSYELTTEEAEAWLHQSDDPLTPIGKALVRKATRQVDQNVAWTCYKRAGYVCEYCGATGIPLTYDHALAQAYGGLTTIENGVSACRPCNKRKGHMTRQEWMDFMKEKHFTYSARLDTL